MAQTTPIKVSFNAGELSPYLDGRTDQAKYFSGCSAMENFVPLVEGPAMRRAGTYFTQECKNSADQAWLFPFKFNVNQSYIIEAGNQYFRFFSNRGALVEAAKVVTAITQANPGVITSAAHGIVAGDYFYLTGIVGMTALNGGYYKAGTVTVNTIQILDHDGVAVNTTAMNAYVSGGAISRVYQVTTPYVVADLTDSFGCFRLKLYQIGDVIYLCHPSYQTRKLSRTGNLAWTMTTVDFQNGPFKDTNTDATITVRVRGENSLAITGAVNNGSGLIRLTVASTANFVTGDHVDVFSVGGVPNANTYFWTITVVDATHIDLVGSTFAGAYTSGGTIRTNAALYKDSTSINTITIIASSGIFLAGHVGALFYLEPPLTNTVKQWEVAKAIVAGDLRKSGNNIYMATNSATTGTVKPTHFEGTVSDGDTGVSWLYVDSGYGIAKITAVNSATNVTAQVVTGVPYSLINNAAGVSFRWAHSLFSTVEGWPEVVGLYRERLALSKGIILAFSVAGDYENHAKKIGGEITDDAAIVLPLPTQNSVRWLREVDDFIVGTGGDEIAVSKITTSDPFGPNNCEAKRQSPYGSSNVEPEVVGDEILHATRSGKRLRALKYDFTSAGYASSDLTILSRHITSEGIIQITYQQEPYSIVWGATFDGYLIGFTFNREQDVLAWHRHPLGGDAIVESVCSIPSPDGTRDDLWMIGLRTINGTGRRYVEWMTPEFDGTDATIAAAFYVDCGLTYSGLATTNVTGAQHLRGQTVDIFANGGAHAQKVVAADGSVALDFSATTVQLGLPCPAKLRTMRMEAGSQLGTAQGKIKRIDHLLLRAYKTLGGKFGPNSDNYDEIIYREAGEPMDTPPAMLSGDKRLPFPSGYETEGFAELYFDSPTPATIINLVLEAEVHE